MNKYEIFACGQILHSWPDDLSFQEILDLCHDAKARAKFNDAMEECDQEDQQLTVCEMFECFSWPAIGELLDDLATSARAHFPNIEL